MNVQTSVISGNEVVAFDRAASGALTQAETVSTGCLGSGAGLGDQGALAKQALLEAFRDWTR